MTVNSRNFTAQEFSEDLLAFFFLNQRRYAGPGVTHLLQFHLYSHPPRGLGTFAFLLPFQSPVQGDLGNSYELPSHAADPPALSLHNVHKRVCVASSQDVLVADGCRPEDLLNSSKGLESVEC